MTPELSLLRARWIAAIALAAAPACTTTTTSADAALADVPAAPDVPDAPVVTDAAVATDAAEVTDGAPQAPVCPSGTPGRECFTRAQLEQMLRFPGGGPATDAGLPIDAGYAPNGCMLPEFARNSCCNSAQVGPWVEGDQCCYWFCQGACCGRAFTVEGVARVAEVLPGGAWSEASTVARLDGVTARALAAAWRADAQMEHASIASFARATLSLLSLGAPPELLADTQRAVLDEVDHARRAFTLASRYAGRDEAPGPLELRGACDPMDLESFALDTLRSGCVGESLAAVAAATQRDLATDPLAREALTRIADDEARHAELAWRTLAWCARVGGAPLRRALLDAWRGLSGGAVLGPFADRAPGVSPAAWAAHGRLDAAQQAESARATWRALIAPCVSAVLPEGVADA
ncbi:MAG: ferritin-like domain-containing protein [Polyangiales bacterium]